MPDLARDLAMAADPVAMARAVGVEPYDWAKAALRSPAPRECWVVSRQGSKSTTAALMALHLATYRAGSLAVCVSPSQRQANELLAKVRQAYSALGRPVGAVSEAIAQLTLENGSRVVSLPSSEASIRGYAADLVLLDEAAKIERALYEAIRPMVAVTGGRIVMLSTPWLAEGFFWEAATGADPGWVVRTVPCWDIPTIRRDFLDAELASLGRSVFAREYECSFENAGAGLFTLAQLRALTDPALRAPYPGG
ncbi:MAG: terminase large subunit domain-containing protein [Candidatus Limnocylindrales bacterium]